jgi:hypothetical protein
MPIQAETDEKKRSRRRLWPLATALPLSIVFFVSFLALAPVRGYRAEFEVGRYSAVAFNLDAPLPPQMQSPAGSLIDQILHAYPQGLQTGSVGSGRGWALRIGNRLYWVIEP